MGLDGCSEFFGAGAQTALAPFCVFLYIEALETHACGR